MGGTTFYNVVIKVGRVGTSHAVSYKEDTAFTAANYYVNLSNGVFKWLLRLPRHITLIPMKDYGVVSKVTESTFTKNLWTDRTPSRSNQMCVPKPTPPCLRLTIVLIRMMSSSMKNGLAKQSSAPFSKACSRSVKSVRVNKK